MARVTVEPIDGSVRAGPCPMSGFRSSLSRARFLVLSNFGRASGWYIELDGKRVGELVDPQWADMFWDSYTVRAWSDVLRDDTLWNDCRLSFWSQQTGERVTGAFAGGSPPFIRDNRVGMRGLYLTPSSRLESWLVDLYLLRRRLRRRRSRTWCCVSARGRFESRQDSGQFLVAGLNPEYGGFIFVNGFNMAHRADYSDLLKAIRTGTGALSSPLVP